MGKFIDKLLLVASVIILLPPICVFLFYEYTFAWKALTLGV